MTILRGPSTIVFGGRTIHRQHGFVDINALTCPDHHRVKRAGSSFGERGALTCTHRPAAGQGECGALLWILLIPGDRYQQRFYAADVTFQELAMWEQRLYSAEDVLRYLGGWFTRAGDPPNDRALQRMVG